MNEVVLIVVGLVALLGGAEMLVRGGAAIAARLGIAPMVVGLTVVSFGTSVPELAIGIDAATRGNAGLAVGNIVGTNIVNLLLILGLSALMVPILIERRVLRYDLPAMLLAALALVIFSLDGHLALWEGLLLLVGAVAYTWMCIATSRVAEPEVVAEYAADSHVAVRPGQARSLLDLVLLVGGIVIIVIGADLLVDGAVDLAVRIGMSDAVIGLTIVAIGTSAPELVTTIVSTVRGNRDIALGNLLGSSVYNIVLILGLTIVVAPGGLAVPPEVLAVDLLLMGAVALVCLPVFLSGRKISRLEGAVFVAAYGGYLAYLLTQRV